MKMKPISVVFTRRKGFSLLEALLSIVIILAAGLGVVELFISADKKNKANTTQAIVQQAASAMNQLLSTDYNATDLKTVDVVKSGLISNTYIGPSDTIVGPYGRITVTQGDTSSEYSVTAENIPGDQAVSICQNMFTSSAVSAGSTTTYATTVGDCQTTFGGKSASKVSMEFSFPREDFINSSDK